MPLTHVYMRRGSSETHRKTVLKAIHQALHETAGIHAKAYFMTLNEFDDANFHCSPDFFDIQRTEALLLIQITLSSGHAVEEKKHLYVRVTELLEQQAGVSPSDVFINLVESAGENWSPGKGLAPRAPA